MPDPEPPHRAGPWAERRTAAAVGVLELERKAENGQVFTGARGPPTSTSELAS